MTHARVPQPMELREPLDYEDGREAMKKVREQRVAAREELEKRTEELADKERLYRKARATAYVTVTGKSADERKAKVDEKTADARYERDVAKGMVDAQREKLEEIDGTRASLHKLIDWSMKLDPFVAEHRAREREAQTA